MSDEYIKIDERKYWLKCLVNDILGNDDLCNGCKYVDHGFCPQCRRIGANEIIKIIDADVASVVRCKECKHHDPEDKKCDCGHAIQWQVPRDDDWFCADGERKEAKHEID